MLSPIFIVGFCGFLFSLVLTPICRDLFRRIGIVDRPDQNRKLHEQPVPHMGGVPIALAFLGSWLLLALFPSAAFPHLWNVWRALPAGIIIFVLSLVMEIRHYRQSKTLSAIERMG